MVRKLAGFAVVALALAMLASLLVMVRTPPQAPVVRALDVAVMPEAGSDRAALYATRCSGCHALPDPTMHTAGEWPGVVRRMGAHINVGVPKAVQGPTPAEVTTIVEYLQAHARK